MGDPKNVHVTPEGVTLPRGSKMASGKGWRLIDPTKKTAFKASLLGTINVKGEQVAVFRVLEKPESLKG